MIFTELVLHNFGIYRGRHVVDLTPVSPEKPILLFGGLNGGGKTTFLDAMKLALYGKLADCSNRKDLPYETYLEGAINRFCSPKEGAALELEFVSYRDGRESRFRVKRYWKKNSKSVSEQVEVLEDGALNPVLSKYWLQYVDDFIPQDIANLFFFDGEKIETLADKSTSASIIRTGIYSLLGLNVIDKLDSDLRELNKRRASKSTDNPALEKLDVIEQSLRDYHNQREILVSRKASEHTDLDQNSQELDKAKKALQSIGGNFYDDREKNQALLEEFNRQVSDNEESMRSIASGIAPLMLVSGLFSKAESQVKREEQSKIANQLIGELELRDKKILSLITDCANTDVVLVVQNWMSENIAERSDESKKACYLNIDPIVFEALHSSQFEALAERAKCILESNVRTVEEKNYVEQQLAATPEESSVRPLLDKVRALEIRAIATVAKISLLETETVDIEKRLKELDEKQRTLNLALIDSEFEQDKVKLISMRSNKVSQTLELYRQAMLKRHLAQLEELIFDSFCSLARKSNLLSKIDIDPNSFEITVFDSNKDPLPTERLSAGERQLFAVSILWGLAKASGRPLPAIVDTPLGRLDSKHRTHLVENYFPRASHQVILLSTDEEIDQRYRAKLSKHIGKEFHIQYIPDEKTSSITPGYF